MRWAATEEPTSGWVLIWSHTSFNIRPAGHPESSPSDKGTNNSDCTKFKKTIQKTLLFMSQEPFRLRFKGQNCDQRGFWWHRLCRHWDVLNGSKLSFLCFSSLSALGGQRDQLYELWGNSCLYTSQISSVPSRSLILTTQVLCQSNGESRFSKIED